MRTTVLISVLVLFICGGLVQADPDKPNIVLLISDDQDYEHLGFMGNTFVHTPSIDALAEAGVVFTTAHLPMSRCHPTLASMLSGRHPHQSGLYYNYGSKPLSPTNSLPNLLKRAGYATYVEGKFWEGDPRVMGFTHGAGKTANTFVRKGQETLYQFIDETAGKKPFFIWWAPKIPHTPHNPPSKYRELYDYARMPIPSYLKQQGIDPDAKSGNKSWRDKEQTLYAMDAWLDDGVGQLIAKLKEAGQYDNTLFVFVIDNGWCNGLVSKGSPFEKGVRTPMTFTYPGKIQKGQRFDGLVSTLDMYPTILDYAGVPVPKTASGRSLKPVIEGDRSQLRDELYGAIYPAFATKTDERAARDIYAIYIRTERWKYIYYLQDVKAERNRNYLRIQSICTDYPTRQAGEEDLYAIDKDPYELNDLADQPGHDQLKKTLRAKCLQWWEQTGGQPLKLAG